MADSPGPRSTDGAAGRSRPSSHRTEARAASPRQPSCSSLAPTVPAARRPPRLPPPSRIHSPLLAPGRSPRPVRAACPTRSRDDSGTRARPSPRPRHNKSWPKAARQRRDAHRSGRGSAHPPSVDCLHAGRACELQRTRRAARPKTDAYPARQKSTDGDAAHPCRCLGARRPLVPCAGRERRCQKLERAKW